MLTGVGRVLVGLGLLCICAVGLASPAGLVTYLDPQSQESVRGGSCEATSTFWCITQATTCPDPTYSANCEALAKNDDCYQCKMTVTNYPDCTPTMWGGYKCDKEIPAENPYCAGLYKGTKVDGQCVNCTNNQNTPCGKKIPNICAGSKDCPSS